MQRRGPGGIEGTLNGFSSSLGLDPRVADKGRDLDLVSLPLLCAGEISVAANSEVERLRAAGMKGVQQIRVGEKLYDVDLDSFTTVKDAGEWYLSALRPACSAVALALAAYSRISRQ
jgi:hypothetical protein